MTTETLLVLFGLTGGVVVISALASGVLERRGFSLVQLFLVIGIAVGPFGLGIIDFDFGSPALRIAATLSLTMVLFADAVSVRPAEVREHAGLAALILGPGTILVATIIAVAGWYLLDLSVAGAVIVGGALASTDPVLLRSVLRNPRASPRLRQALRLESGLNDAVLLPVVLIGMTFLGSEQHSAIEWVKQLAAMFALGPVIGVAVGLLCVALLDFIRRRYGMRRDYESLYTIGVALTAFVAAEVLHASGFLAAFAAGLAIAFKDVELCDCFHDYGEATAEIALLLTFVALGTSLIWTGVDLITMAGVLFVVIALAARPISLLIVLQRAELNPRELRLLAWYGPRGLSTLLLALLPVFAGAPNADHLFAVCALVVIVSVVLHGLSPALVRTDHTPADEGDVRITLDRYREVAANEPGYVLDVRTESSFQSSDRMAESALRVSPSGAVNEVRRLGLPADAWLWLYCT